MISNFRHTKARKAILDIFEKSTLPLSAGQVNQKVDVNKTTIYRELEFLVDKKILTSVNFGDGVVRFEKNSDHHHHVVCDTCGKVEDIVLDEFKLFQSIKPANFKITRHSLEFFGLCKNCR